MLVSLAAPAASADLVRLTNGQTMEGVVMEETNREIRLQIDWQGYTTLDRSIVQEVVLEGPALNERRREQWRQDRAVLIKRQEDQAAFDAAQREKGLIKRGEDWVTPEAVAALESAERQEELSRLEQRLAEISGRLQALESENQALRDELARTRSIASYPAYAFPGGLVLHRQQSRRHSDRHRGLFRDDQGNVVRVRDHGKHKAFTAPDGTHVDVEFRNGRPGFTDPTGTFRELTPLLR